jgi:hypothetical protein
MQTRTTTFDSLSSAQYANLTTFRRSGIAVSTRATASKNVSIVFKEEKYYYLP